MFTLSVSELIFPKNNTRTSQALSFTHIFWTARSLAERPRLTFHSHLSTFDVLTICLYPRFPTRRDVIFFFGLPHPRRMDAYTIILRKSLGLTFSEVQVQPNKWI